MRNFTIVDAPQRSALWHLARCGKLTGSRAADMLAVILKSEAAGRRNLRAQLVLERLTGRQQESGYQSPAMLQGIEREAGALALYEAIKGDFVSTTGFLAHSKHKAGCSLDGHVKDFEGIVEAKSPEAANHLEYLTTGKVPGKYLQQIHHCLWISGAQWCDWLSYNPDFPESMQVKLVRVERVEAEIKAYEDKALAFLAEVDTAVASIRTQFNLRDVLQEAVA